MLIGWVAMTSFPHSMRARQFLLDNLPFALLIELALVNVASVGHPLRPRLLEAAQVPVNGPPRHLRGLGCLVFVFRSNLPLIPIANRPPIPTEIRQAFQCWCRLVVVIHTTGTGKGPLRKSRLSP